MPVVRDYIAAHAAMYRAIKEADTVDADGDGVAASVGLHAVGRPTGSPRANNAPSERSRRRGARDRLVYVYHHLFVDSLHERQLRRRTSTASPTSSSRSGRARSTGSACSTTSAPA